MIGTNIDRRAFLKAIGATALAAALPLEVAVITFTGLYIEDAEFREALRFGGFRKDGDRAVVDVTIDTVQMWRAVRLQSDDGAVWYTRDEGQTWHDLWNDRHVEVEL